MYTLGRRCAILVTLLMTIASPGVAGEGSLVFVPRADSPGDDYSSVADSSFHAWARRCDVQPQSKAFTFNHFDYTCFLKRAVRTSTTFHAFAITGVKLSLSDPGTGTGNTATHIVTIPQVDSPGNDYATFTLFTTADCQRSCEADKACNAFTYNQARSACFLKRAANQWLSFYPWATTGVKLSPVKQEPTSVAPESQDKQTSPRDD